MEPTLEDAIQVHRIFQASDRLILGFPEGLQTFLVEVLWSGGDVLGVAQELDLLPAIAQGAYRAYRVLLLEQCPELQEMSRGSQVH